MTTIDLTEKEKSLIEILRLFSFLHELGYAEYELTYAGRSNPSLTYRNYRGNRVVHIIGDETEMWKIVVTRKKFLSAKKSVVFDTADYFKLFNSGMIKGK